MSELEDAFHAAEPLDPDDRVRLIARLWASLPEDYWAVPSEHDRAGVHAMLANNDTQELADLPQRIAQQLVSGSANQSAQKIYSAPRRFDLSTILAVTAAYSVGLAMLRGFDTPPPVMLYFAIFITIVGVAQAMLFGGNKPRLASVLTGIVISFLGILFVPHIGRFHSATVGDLIGFAFLVSISLGPLFGYLAGGLVGGVFLVADKLRDHLSRHNTDTEITLEPVETDAT